MALPLRNSRIRLSQGQIFWREIGQGEALVFLHGSWDQGSQWLPILERLGDRYHCFAPDLLGFGESERPNVHYSIELQVECLAEYLEALRLRRVYLVGHSLGAWIATSYALKYLDQVQGLILLEPEGVQVEGMGNRWAWASWLMGKPPVMLWLLRPLQAFKFLGFQAKIERSLQQYRQMRQSPTACKLLFQRRRAEIKSELLQERLSWLKVPVLVLHPENQSATLALSKTYAELAPEGKLQMIPEVSPDLPQTAPDVVTQQIQSFVLELQRSL